MSKLSVDQKTIKDLFTDKSANFLIPDYQRPYGWEEEECQTLWDDIFTFAFPDGNKDAFNTNDEYFLGAIVTYKNANRQLEVIDGQQRLTTILLLLRAFYDRFERMQDKPSIDTRNIISQCIWQTNEFGNADNEHLKIDSEVATDDDKEEFLSILKTGNSENKMNSRYAKNYHFFQKNIDLFIDNYASYLPYFPARILNNCILLPIEADSQDTALRIFSTLNDRGMPLADADIFKAQFYKYYEKKGAKSEFIDDWKELSVKSERIFNPIFGTPMDELFTKYMYYIRSSEGNRSSTTEALRKFFGANKYSRLLRDNSITNLIRLIDFWGAVYDEDGTKFADRVLKKLFVLKYAPNGMWEYFTSVDFMVNKDEDENLDDADFDAFLSKTTAFIYAYALTNPGVNALRTPIYAEMIKVQNNQAIDFSEFKFDREHLNNVILNYKFTNNRTVTRSIITWYAFTFEEQLRPSNGTGFDIEHIYAKERHNKEIKLSNQDKLE